MAAAGREVSLPTDPLNSPLWPGLVERYLGVTPIAFDDRVKVVLPPVTEDQTHVPILIDARGLVGEIEEILVLTDLHPFQRTLRFQPLRAEPFLAYRMKIEQGTAIRAAVKLNGEWRVGGAYLDAAGGGCSVKPPSTKVADLSKVGEIRARLWPEGRTGARLRLRIDHPMDNGMINNIPAYFVETVEISDPNGETLARLELSEAISPEPTFTLLLAERAASTHVQIRARDNNGGEFRGDVGLSDATSDARQGSLVR